MTSHSPDAEDPSKILTVVRTEHLVWEYFEAVWNEGDLSVISPSTTVAPAGARAPAVEGVRASATTS